MAGRLKILSLLLILNWLPAHNLIALKHVPGSERTQLACLQLTGILLPTLLWTLDLLSTRIQLAIDPQPALGKQLASCYWLSEHR